LPDAGHSEPPACNAAVESDGADARVTPASDEGLPLLTPLNVDDFPCIQPILRTSSGYGHLPSFSCDTL
jgi:hypothetical protein